MKSEKLIGQRIKCPNCEQHFVVYLLQTKHGLDFGVNKIEEGYERLSDLHSEEI